MKRIAIAQINVDYDNFDSNVARSYAYIEKAIRNQCDMIIFPELWSSGFRLENCSFFSERNSQLFTELQIFSTKNQIEIVGSYINHIGNRFFNQFICFHPGLSYSHYEKINLFPTLMETAYLKKGKNTTVFPSTIGQVGASICFDLRFQSIYGEERNQGAEVFIIPAHWPLERIHHWDILLQARAIEHSTFVIGVNSVGQSGNVFFGGHSAVISPDGEVIFQADEKNEGLHVVEIDLGQVQRIREKYRFLRK